MKRPDDPVTEGPPIRGKYLLASTMSVELGGWVGVQAKREGLTIAAFLRRLIVAEYERIERHPWAQRHEQED
jgi:hypothetical protein